MSRKIAVCIGINDYPGTGSDLSGCVNDAMDWSQELGRREFSITRLLDQEASGDGIRAALRECAETAEGGDLVVVTYSGHGTFVLDEDGDEADGMDECWCPHDIAMNGPITDDELNVIFSSRKAGVRWVVLSDSCHSGTVSRFGTSSAPVDGGEGAAIPQARFLPPATFDRRAGRGRRSGLADARVMASAPGRNSALLISGCQDSEYSWDAYFDGRANGAFTFEALRVLATLDDDATYADWHERIRQHLPAARYPQSPNLYCTEDMAGWAVLKVEEEDAGHDAWAAGLHDRDGAASVQEPSAVGRQLGSKVIEHRSRARSMGVEARRSRGEGDRERRILLAEGDSWFAFPWTNVVTCLEDSHGFEVFSDASNGDLIETMAYSGGYLDKFLRTIQRLKRNGVARPKAILLSGGGNDVVGDALKELLNHARSPSPGLNEKILQGVVHERLRDAYVTMLTALTALCQHEYGSAIKIVTHGYDYVVPDGRGFRGWWVPVAGPWMKPEFDRKGYGNVSQNKAHVRELINELNGMLSSLPSITGLGHVVHLDLRQRLPNGPDYKRWWIDELHPTKRGFKRVADEFARII